MKKIKIYTDGACSGNPGDGGWGALLFYGKAFKEICGFEANTTNNRMELFAAIAALRLLKERCEVELYSDSAYLVNAFNEGWVQNWLSNGFKSATKKEVKNIDLWQELILLANKHKVKFFKVKGHADNPHNNRCDELATGAVLQHRKNLPS